MKLKEWRQREVFSQADIAEQIGCSQASVSDWERGVSVPEASQMRAINDLTKGCVTPNDFVLTDA